MNNASDEVRLESRDTTIIAAVRPDGSFQMSLPLVAPWYFEYVGNEFCTIYLSPGDSLHMSVDAGSWRSFDTTLVFTGRGAAINNYLVAKSRLVDSLYYDRESDLLASDSAVFGDVMSQIRSRIESMLAAISSGETQVQFVAYENALLDMHDCMLRLSYIQRSDREVESFAARTMQSAHELLGRAAVDQVYSKLPLFRDLVLRYAELSAAAANPGDELLVIKLNTVADLPLDERTLADVVERLVEETYEDFGKKRETLVTIERQCQERIASIARLVSSVYIPVESGYPAPCFRLTSLDGQVVTLVDYRGKYVYLDIWATYCGPCIREIPAFEQLKKRYHDRNILFVSISVDRQEALWRGMVNRMHMTPVQLKTDNDWSSDFVRAYRIDHFGIPHYFLLDPSGIVVMDNAPKPSQMAAHLDSLFGQ